MAKVKVVREGLKLDGKLHPAGEVIEIDDEIHLRNLTRSGKVQPHNIDAVLAGSGKTLTDQIDVDRADAERVMAGPAITSEAVAAESGAASEKPAKKTTTKKKVLSAKNAPKK